MELVSEPEPWTGTVTCPKCASKWAITEADIQTDGFKHKVDTYWFDGSASSVPGFFVGCRKCKNEIVLCIPRAFEKRRRVLALKLPEYVMTRVKLRTHDT